jgi:hypothetical protein
MRHDHVSIAYTASGHLGNPRLYCDVVATRYNSDATSLQGGETCPKKIGSSSRSSDIQWK